jgi:hypothetical protein
MINDETLKEYFTGTEENDPVFIFTEPPSEEVPYKEIKLVGKKWNWTPGND